MCLCEPVLNCSSQSHTHVCMFLPYDDSIQVTQTIGSFIHSFDGTCGLPWEHLQPACGNEINFGMELESSSPDVPAGFAPSIFTLNGDRCSVILSASDEPLPSPPPPPATTSPPRPLSGSHGCRVRFGFSSPWSTEQGCDRLM